MHPIEEEIILVDIEDTLAPGSGRLTLKADPHLSSAVAGSDALLRKWIALCGRCIRLRLEHELAFTEKAKWQRGMNNVKLERDEALHEKNRVIMLEKALRLLDARLKDIAAGGTI